MNLYDIFVRSVGSYDNRGVWVLYQEVEGNTHEEAHQNILLGASGSEYEIRSYEVDRSQTNHYNLVVTRKWEEV